MTAIDKEPTIEGSWPWMRSSTTSLQPRESDRLVMAAVREYDAMTPDERAAVDRAWADRSEWEREQVRAELEFDLF